jgi:hypothetical protein
MYRLTSILLGGFIVENLITEEKKEQFVDVSSMQVWERVGQLADIADSEEYFRCCKDVVPLIINEVKQINSEVRLLFGKPGDAHLWVISANKKVKLYRVIQKLANLLSEDIPIRIKMQTEAKAVDMYMGILKLKICMDMLQVFADSYRRMLPIESTNSKLKVDLTFIVSTAIEIDDDLNRVLESTKLRKNSYI